MIDELKERDRKDWDELMSCVLITPNIRTTCMSVRYVLLKVGEIRCEELWVRVCH